MKSIKSLSMQRSTMQRLALGVIALGAFAAVACQTPETNVTLSQSESTGIAVTGSGSVTVVPDIGLLNLGVEITRPTVAEARGAAADAMEAMRESLSSNGVEDKDIQTQYFNIYPQYQYSDNEAPRITGFTVSNQVQVKVREIDNVSTVLDEAIDAGGDAVRVNNISFTVDEPEQYLGEARDKAFADAKERAEQLASLAGVDLGRVRTINESYGSAPVQFDRVELAAPASGGGTSTPIGPGEAEVTLTVNVVFEIQ
ncbi:MAG: SIMPL domain-containing protein [Dehalococcoidia bacterium]